MEGTRNTSNPSQTLTVPQKISPTNRSGGPFGIHFNGNCKCIWINFSHGMKYVVNLSNPRQVCLNSLVNTLPRQTADSLSTWSHTHFYFFGVDEAKTQKEIQSYLDKIHASEFLALKTLGESLNSCVYQQRIIWSTLSCILYAPQIVLCSPPGLADFNATPALTLLMMRSKRSTFASMGRLRRKPFRSIVLWTPDEVRRSS